MFHLLKDYRRLPINTYVVNWILYLNNIILNAAVTLDEFSQTIDVSYCTHTVLWPDSNHC